MDNGGIWKRNFGRERSNGGVLACEKTLKDYCVVDGEPRFNRPLIGHGYLGDWHMLLLQRKQNEINKNTIFH